METEKFLNEIKFDDRGLIVAVTQDYITNEVLMVAYMNREALAITLKEKRACYYSRSRNCLWRKGETSGHVQRLKGLYYDCDADAILLKVDQVGNACHTGAYSCFFNKVYEEVFQFAGYFLKCAF
jgi:phosphoribosyl-ATP pyrophosphohydrolase/phosphoribosyl-AMP cyclohydrolase